jgi:transformation/transcription domain-associated protein
LKELSHADQRVAVELWVQLFPQAWKSLNEDSRIALVRPLTSFLSQHYHRKQLKHGGGFGYRRNIIQAMLNGILYCRPMPYLPAELIRFLGKTYNAWHTSIAICEQQVFHNEKLKGIDLQQWSEALESLYVELNEKDYGRGIQQMLCKSKETQVSLDLQANGQWKQAQEILTNAISEHAARDLSTYETNGWRKDWVECCRQLAEWDVLKLYCASADEPNVLMECAWKSPDWSLVKSLFKTPSVVAKVEDALLPDINTSMLRIYTEIKNWNLDEVDMYYNEAVQIVLRKWQSLPASTSASHIPLFQRFQNIVELQESIIIMSKLQKTKRTHGNAHPHQMPDLTTHLHV